MRWISVVPTKNTNSCIWDLDIDLCWLEDSHSKYPKEVISCISSSTFTLSSSQHSAVKKLPWISLEIGMCCQVILSPKLKGIPQKKAVQSTSLSFKSSIVAVLLCGIFINLKKNQKKQPTNKNLDHIPWSGAMEYLGNQVLYKVFMLSLPWLAGDDTGANHQVLLTNQLKTSCYLIYSLIKYLCF